MANQQQVDLLKQGVATAWNTSREEHSDTPITLNGVDLSEALLEWAMLEGALITSEQLSQAKVGPDSL